LLCTSALCLGFVPPLVQRIRFVSFVQSLAEIVKILLGEDRDVELGARTSKHILVFAFGSLNSSRFISYIATIVYLYMLDKVCVLILVII